jgi:hypothetical protein
MPVENHPRYAEWQAARDAWMNALTRRDLHPVGSPEYQHWDAEAALAKIEFDRICSEL